VPASVWLTGQVCPRDQRRGRYLTASNAHPAKMYPATARKLITTYTRPGELVFDPMAGIGTTIIEAIHLSRTGLGVEYEPRWARLAAAGIDHAHTQGATGTGQVVAGDARQLPDLLPARLRDRVCGRVALVVTSPPYGPSTHGNPREYAGPGGRVAVQDRAYGHNPRELHPGNLAHAEADQLADGFIRILAGCLPLLAPGAHVAVTARPYRHRGELVDIPGMVVGAAQAAGLRLHDRCIPLLSGIRAGRIVARPSFFQLRHIRAAHQRGDPQWLLQHEIALIFIHPGGSR
jgi:tRNA G10  N-methylase Trm11